MDTDLTVKAFFKSIIIIIIFYYISSKSKKKPKNNFEITDLEKFNGSILFYCVSCEVIGFLWILSAIGNKESLDIVFSSLLFIVAILVNMKIKYSIFIARFFHLIIFVLFLFSMYVAEEERNYILFSSFSYKFYAATFCVAYLFFSEKVKYVFKK